MDRPTTRIARIARKLVTAALATVLALSLAGVALGATFAVKATNSDTWQPAHRYIGRNDVVRWRNPTNRVHDVTAYGRNWSFSRVIKPGESVTRKFRARGNFRYRCARHSAIVSGRCRGMCGIVHVVSG